MNSMSSEAAPKKQLAEVTAELGNGKGELEALKMQLAELVAEVLRTRTRCFPISDFRFK